MATNASGSESKSSFGYFASTIMPEASKKQYINLTVTSGYEWKYKVLAVVRTSAI